MKKIFIAVLISAPLFWSVVSNLGLFIAEWVSVPGKVMKMEFIPGESDYLKLNEIRMSGVERLNANKLSVFAFKLADSLSVLSPRVYFQSGDGSALSPKSVSPVFSGLFFLWIFGITRLNKRQTTRLFKIVATTLAISFLAQTRSIAILSPIFLSYLYISLNGLNSLVAKKPILYFLLITNVFILIRYYIYG